MIPPPSLEVQDLIWMERLPLQALLLSRPPLHEEVVSLLEYLPRWVAPAVQREGSVLQDLFAFVEL